MRPVWPPVGTVRRLGLRRTEPISRAYGFDRGTPVDRHYIEAFLQRHAPSPDYSAGDIRGRVLEVEGTPTPVASASVRRSTSCTLTTRTRSRRS